MHIRVNCVNYGAAINAESTQIWLVLPLFAVLIEWSYEGTHDAVAVNPVEPESTAVHTHTSPGQLAEEPQQQ